MGACPRGAGVGDRAHARASVGSGPRCVLVAGPGGIPPSPRQAQVGVHASAHTSTTEACRSPTRDRPTPNHPPIKYHSTSCTQAGIHSETSTGMLSRSVMRSAVLTAGAKRRAAGIRARPRTALASKARQSQPHRAPSLAAGRSWPLTPSYQPTQTAPVPRMLMMTDSVSRSQAMR